MSEHKEPFLAEIAWLLLAGEIPYVFLAARALFVGNSRHAEFWIISCLAYSFFAFYCCIRAAEGKKRMVWILLPFASAIMPFLPIIIFWTAVASGGFRYGH